MDQRGDWHLRPAITAAIGLVAAVAIQQLVDSTGTNGVWTQPGPGRIALATALGVAAILAIFTVERVRWVWSVVFSLGLGCVAGLVTWWSGPGNEAGWIFDWRTACLFLSIAIAAPLFQTARDAGGRRFDYVEVHGHVWTNIVLWGAACAFTGIAFALTYLLSELFSLIGIHVLRDLLKHGWANAALAGTAFGGAAGLFRESDTVVRTLQRVITAVLAVLAPMLGAGLLLFLIALPFTGLGALWEATKSTTPILLACAIGAFVLINAVLGDGEEEERGRVLHWGAIGLGIAVLPLAVIAAVATGLRIGQYGFTPDRLWALTFVIVTCAYGVAYLVTLLRWRQGWAVHLRPANLRLAFALCALALLLATPIVSFNAISTRDQVARLESGRTTADKFDWAALAYDFGAPGRVALRKLTVSKNVDLRSRAIEVSKAPNRWVVQHGDSQIQRREELTRTLRVVPKGVELPSELRDQIANNSACTNDFRCTLAFIGTEAFLFNDACFRTPARSTERRSDKPAFDLPDYCRVAARYMMADGKWTLPVRSPSANAAVEQSERNRGFAEGRIDIRPVQRRQAFVGGIPVGEAFE